MGSFNLKNWTPKIISVFFALIIWVYVMSEINPRTIRNEHNIPIHFLNIEEMQQKGLAIKGDLDHTISVRIIGRRDAVYRVSRGQIKATADLLGYRTGINNIPVEVSALEEVEIDFNPKFIRVELEEIISKEKPVKITVEGSPHTGFAIGELQYEPTTVWAKGPESLVNSIERVEGTVKLTGEAQNFTSKLPLKPLNSRGEEVANITLETSYVNVNLPIDQTKTVKINPKTEITTAEGYEISGITVSPNTVTLRGQQEILESIESIDTETIIINNISEDIVRKGKLSLPEGVTIVGTEEVDINITVEPLIEKNFSIEKENIDFRNVKEGFTLDLRDVPDILQVKILGNKAVLEDIDVTDIKIIIDMTGLEANQYTIEPILEIPFLVERKVKKVELTPKTLSVRVAAENG